MLNLIGVFDGTMLLLEMEVKMVWIVTYWDFDQEPVVTPFNNRENAEKCWDYFKEIHDGCRLDECEVFSKFLTFNERFPDTFFIEKHDVWQE